MVVCQNARNKRKNRFGIESNDNFLKYKRKKLTRQILIVMFVWQKWQGNHFDGQQIVQDHRNMLEGYLFIFQIQILILKFKKYVKAYVCVDYLN